MRLLRRHQIRTEMVSLHEHNERRRVGEIVERLSTEDVAVVSDAGTPTISDPGGVLVDAAISAGHQVVPIPGPTAVIAGLVGSGLSAKEFTFVGFLPRDKGGRRRALAALGTEPRTLVLYEAPHRLRRLLQDAREVLGNRRAAVARELTKLHEEFVRADLDTMLAHFEATEPRGEIVLVIEGTSESRPQAVDLDDKANLSRVHEQLAEARARGLKPRQAAAEVSRTTGIPARELYRLFDGPKGIC